MKGFMRFIFILIFVLGGFCSVKGKSVGREVININAAWRYMAGDHVNAASPDFDDSSWEPIGLPHTFSLPYFMSKDFYMGYGWYRKTLDINKRQASKRFFLEFDGVFFEAEIFINGQVVGHHEGGYTGFSIDITPYVKVGSNQLAVRVNNIWRPDRAPRAGEHTFSGGIYRNVRLIVKERAYIDWYGTFVTTPDLAENKGQKSAVRIVTDLTNTFGCDKKYELRTEILDKECRKVTEVSSYVTIPAGSHIQIEQLTPEITRPELWSPEHPYLYRAVTTLYDGRKIMDRSESVLGFRWMEWTADKGFFLNGKHYYLIGANVHQDHAGWGDAVTETGMRRDVRLMKEAGFNFIRGSHYPHSPAFSKACDEEGMLFWAENAFWGIGGFKPDGYWNASAYPVNPDDRKEFDESVMTQLTELIRIHRNHPSVIIWSMCNEVFFSAPEAMDGVRNLLQSCVALSKKLDPTRMAAIGGAQRPLGDGRIDKLGDVAGYNGDGSVIPDFQNPGIPTLVSEYGSVTADRPGKFAPGWGDLARNDAYKGLPWRSGQAIWCGFDHGSIAGSVLGKMGIVDYFRIPKRSWYWYRQNYRNIAPPQWPEEGVPARLKLTADCKESILADGTDDVMLIVEVQDKSGRPISNSPDVTMTVVSGPGEFPTGRSITFSQGSDICIADGKAAIEFRSYYTGHTVVRVESEGLVSDSVQLDFVGGMKYNEKRSLQVESRPYVRYVRENTSVDQVFGRNNPTFSSSSEPGHASGMAADGVGATYWQSSSDDVSPWWILDTEKGLTLLKIRLNFAKQPVSPIRIEASVDRQIWQTIAECRSDMIRNGVAEINLKNSPSPMRFVRLCFSSQPAFLSEVEVVGRVER